MLGFSCSPCAPNSNVSQHEAHSPLAVSFSQRAKVTWLAAVSHLTMLKHWRSAALPASVMGGGGFFAVARLQQAFHDEAPSPVPTGALPFFPRVNYYSHSNCCPDASLITPAESCTGVLFGSSPATGLSPPPTYPLSPSLLPHRLFILRQI